MYIRLGLNVNYNSIHFNQIKVSVLSQLLFEFSPFTRTLKLLWRAPNGFKISNEGGHKVVFTFDEKEDVDRILASEPWSFDKALVVLQRYDKISPLEELNLDKTSFWVQVHNILISYRNRAVAEDICEAIGLVDRSTADSECEGGSYIRVRVTLNVFQPLCRGRIIRLDEGEKIWVNFRYERLPNLCYWCGCLDHGDKECDIWIQSKGTLQVTSQQYDSWIRAISTGTPKKNVVHVSGYYEDRKENISTQRRRATKTGSFPVPPPDKENEADKEVADMEVDFMVI